VKASYRELRDNDEIRQKKDIYVSTSAILLNVCAFYHIKNDELYSTKRGYFNEPRSAAIFLMRRLRRDSLPEIGQIFHVKKYSTISSTIERMKIRMQKDPKLKKRIENLEAFIYKSQEQT